MKLKGAEKLLCPCHDCQNVIIQRSAEIVQYHLIRRGFKAGYTRWVLHREMTLNDGNGTNELDSGSNNLNECKSKNVQIFDSKTNVREEFVCHENIETMKNVDNLDEMMNDVPVDFINDNPEIFQKLSKESDIPLYPGCTKFMKIRAIFRLDNLKDKNN
jgi:Transposase-associated domain